MARRLLLSPGVGERLLTSKLQILAGTGNRRPSPALAVLTGGVSDPPPAHAPLSALGDVDSGSVTARRGARNFAARTVYLSAGHLSKIDCIIEAWQQVEPRRLTRSAVLRRAVDHLRTAVEAEPVKFILEND